MDQLQVTKPCQDIHKYLKWVTTIETVNKEPNTYLILNKLSLQYIVLYLSKRFQASIASVELFPSPRYFSNQSYTPTQYLLHTITGRSLCHCQVVWWNGIHNFSISDHSNLYNELTFSMIWHIEI